MKKICLALVSMTMVHSVLAAQFSDGAQYVTINKPMTHEPEVLEFFSFYCRHCYQFEQIYHISERAKKELPPGTRIVRYHVTFLGPLGKLLTQAWAVAIALNVEDKVSPLMFGAVQHNPTIHTPDDIRNIFVKAGINATDYDAAWNSLGVKSLIMQQERGAETYQLQSVPTIFVNGKYMVKNDGLDTSSMNAYIKQFSEVIKFLNKKK
ncbi:thiol:disulfide interchange protein DsbA [Candidatus Gillettellia adelgis]